MTRCVGALMPPGIGNYSGSKPANRNVMFRWTEKEKDGEWFIELLLTSQCMWQGTSNRYSYKYPYKHPGGAPL